MIITDLQTFRCILLSSVTLNMKRSAVLIVVILRCVVRVGGVECYVCEAEYNEIICRTPSQSSVKDKAVFCFANITDDTWCSTTVYKRKCGANTGNAQCGSHAKQCWGLVLSLR